VKATITGSTWVACAAIVARCEIKQAFALRWTLRGVYERHAQTLAAEAAAAAAADEDVDFVL
jgi:hypothetical protein